MSIATEIQRIQQAKTGLKTAIEKRGVSVSADVLVDSYPQILETAPYAVKGTFTPEEDTKVFSVSGLPFEPKTMNVVCADLYSSGVADTFYCVTHIKGVMGYGVYWSDKIVTSITRMGASSSLMSWGEDSVSFDASKSGLASTNRNFFKAGYTYEYFISGGFPE